MEAPCKTRTGNDRRASYHRPGPSKVDRSADARRTPGTGWARVTEGDLGKLPMALRWTKVANFRPPTKTAFVDPVPPPAMPMPPHDPQAEHALLGGAERPEDEIDALQIDIDLLHARRRRVGHGRLRGVVRLRAGDHVARVHLAHTEATGNGSLDSGVTQLPARIIDLVEPLRYRRDDPMETPL